MVSSFPDPPHALRRKIRCKRSRRCVGTLASQTTSHKEGSGLGTSSHWNAIAKCKRAAKVIADPSLYGFRL